MPAVLRRASGPCCLRADEQIKARLHAVPGLMVKDSYIIQLGEAEGFSVLLLLSNLHL